MRKEIKGYRCNQDCTLDYTNFEQGEEIIIADHCEDADWKGLNWYNSFPQIFEPIEFTQNDNFIKYLNDNFVELDTEQEEQVRELLDFHASEPMAAAERIAEYLSDNTPFKCEAPVIFNLL